MVLEPMRKIVMFVIATLILLVVAGLIYEQISRIYVSKKYPVQGKLVDDSDHFIHLEKPEIVIQSIKEVLDSIATGNKLNDNKSQ
jgi:hypothetical protein